MFRIENTIQFIIKKFSLFSQSSEKIADKFTSENVDKIQELTNI